MWFTPWYGQEIFLYSKSGLSSMLPAQLYDVALSGVDILGSFSVILLHNTLPPPKKNPEKLHTSFFFYSCVFPH